MFRKKYILHTIGSDGVVGIQYFDRIPAIPPDCEYRLINRVSEKSHASKGFAAAWKAKTLPEVAKS